MTELTLGLIVLLAVFIYRIHRKNLSLLVRIDSLEASIINLQNISEHFPEFINQGEKITKNLTTELSVKQEQLNKKIDAATEISRKLGYLEEKVKDNQLDKETIDKILILVNQGFSTSEISPRLNVPAGEIDLIIKLRRYLSSPVKEKL